MRTKSAWTTHPNTPESDRLETVLHAVKWIDDAGVEWETTLMARDPIDAMDRLHASPKACT